MGIYDIRCLGSFCIGTLLNNLLPNKDNAIFIEFVMEVDTTFFY
jgi:hypothetical protein